MRKLRKGNYAIFKKGLVEGLGSISIREVWETRALGREFRISRPKPHAKLLLMHQPIGKDWIFARVSHWDYERGAPENVIYDNGVYENIYGNHCQQALTVAGDRVLWGMWIYENELSGKRLLLLEEYDWYSLYVGMEVSFGIDYRFKKYRPVESGGGGGDEEGRG